MMKPHVFMIPYPAQGHINPMLSLAKFLLSKGVYITFGFTNPEYDRLLELNSGSLDFDPCFKFIRIPLEYLPLCEPECERRLVPLMCNLVHEVYCVHGTPPVSCIIADGVMSFTLEVAKMINVPGVLFCTTSACGLLAYSYYENLIEKKYIRPLRDYAHLTDVPLKDIVSDCAPSMSLMCLKDMPSYVRTTDPEDKMVGFIVMETKAARNASAILVNTSESLEPDVLEKLSSTYPQTYAIGPISTLAKETGNSRMKGLKSSLWKEDVRCLGWLDSKEPNSVVYVNFGSLATISTQQLAELEWGLANSAQYVLLVTRENMIYHDQYSSVVEFPKTPSDKLFRTSWCHQETVLNHPAIGGFVTHSGWNSTLDGISSGVPMLCWPLFAEQFTSCWYSCNKWGIAMELDSFVSRIQVEKAVKDLMVGDKGQDLRKKSILWKKKVNKSTSSKAALVNFINNVLLGV